MGDGLLCLSPYEPDLNTVKVPFAEWKVPTDAKESLRMTRTMDQDPSNCCAGNVSKGVESLEVFLICRYNNLV
jgi:hypothetical protein